MAPVESLRVNTHALRRSVRPVFARDPSRVSWAVAILFFGILDVAVTIYALYGIAPESHFAYLAILGAFESVLSLPFFYELLLTLIVWKAGVLIILYGVYRLTPRSFRVGVPVGLCVWGGLVFAWNLHAIGLY